MILIPECQTVLLLVPRTGSGSLRRAIATMYPQSLLLYRHMEADGIPAGYDRWRRVGVVRNPLARLWSLYEFLQDFGGKHDRAYIEAMRSSVSMPFDEWLLSNNISFTSPYDFAGHGRYWPQYTVRHALPENRKSQFVYLRPDLGTTIWQYRNLDKLADEFGLRLEHQNSTRPEPPPELSPAATEYLGRVFKWDLTVTAERPAEEGT